MYTHHKYIHTYIPRARAHTYTLTCCETAAHTYIITIYARESALFFRLVRVLIMIIIMMIIMIITIIIVTVAKMMITKC